MSASNEIFVKVIGSGSFLPGNPIPPDDVEKYLGEITKGSKKVMRWLERIKPLMKEMLDIDFYHYALDPVTRKNTEDNVTMSVKAAKKALAAANMKAEDIEVIVYGSAYNEQVPPTSAWIQEALGIEKCAEISIHANCTSAYKALVSAHDMIRCGRYKNALVVSSAINSVALRTEYLNQAVLTLDQVFLRWFLGDGAGAIILSADDKKQDGLYVEDTFFESVGGNKPSVMGDNRPAYWMPLNEQFEGGHHHLRQKFQDELSTYFHEGGETVFIKGLRRFLAKAKKVDMNDLRFFQINMPSKHVVELIMSECESLGIKKDKLYTKIANMGYPGPPAVFVCLDNMIREEKFNKGDMIISFVTEVSKFMQAGYIMRQY
jgi:3-oxoacyl-[acyl-carrier-protein] synthase III